MRSERKWAVVRLALGMLQVFGATVSLILLLETGTTRLTLGAAAVTTAITLTSILLFRETK